MKTLTVYGYSDDNVVFDGIPGADEFGCYGDTPYRGFYRLISASQDIELHIHVIYHGHWCFAVGPESGDSEEMPDWAIRRVWGGECAYSETLQIDVPDDVVLKNGYP